MEEKEIKLDYSLKTMVERSAHCHKIIESLPKSKLTPRYLEILANYIMEAATREERKERKYLTENRLVTINKRETSYENLISKFENGENGIYSLMIEDKNALLTPKVEITEKDIAEVPGLAELRETIASVEQQFARAKGHDRYILKQQLIDLRRDQYTLKLAHNQPIGIVPSFRGEHPISLEGRKWVDENGEPQSNELISFFNPEHIAALCQYYSSIKAATAHNINSDFYYLLQDFDNLIARTLTTSPLYLDLLRLKMNGKSNLEVQEVLAATHGVKYSVEYISSLYHNKIPKLLAEQAKKDFLVWYYTECEEGTWKICSKCGQTKLAHNKFFSKNNTSKDGFYSICKDCRNAKNKQKKENC